MLFQDGYSAEFEVDCDGWLLINKDFGANKMRWDGRKLSNVRLAVTSLPTINHSPTRGSHPRTRLLNTLPTPGLRGKQGLRE